MLGRAVAQPGHRRAVCTVDLQRQQIIAAHAHVPRGVEVADHAVDQLEGRIRRVVGRALVGLARLVPALREMRRTEAGQRFHFAEQILDHVLPVAEHIDDDAAVLLLAVIPRRALQFLANVIGEHQFQSFTAHRAARCRYLLINFR